MPVELSTGAVRECGPFGSQNCSVDVKSAQQSPILGLDVVRENLDCEVAHAHLPVKVLELALHHNVEGLEQKRVEVGLDFLFTFIFFKFFELLGFHSCTKQESY